MNITGQTHEGRDQLISDLKLVIKDAEDLLRNTGQQVGVDYQSARTKFESTLKKAKNSLDITEEQLVAGAKNALKTTDRYVQDNPWQAVGVVAVGALVLGLLFGRK